MLCACSSCLRSDFLDGLEQLRDGDFALLERGLRRDLVAAEDLARQLEEGLAVGVERQARGAFDGGAHLRLVLRQQFGGARALLLVAGDPRAGIRQLDAQVLGAPRGAQRADRDIR